MQSTAKLNEVKRLSFKILKACKGKELSLVFAALENNMEAVLEQIEHPGHRYRLVARLLHMLLESPIFAGLDRSPRLNDAAAIAAIEDHDLRAAAVLAAIKPLLSLSPPLAARTPGFIDEQFGALRKAVARKFSRQLNRISSRHLQAWGIENDVDTIDDLVRQILWTGSSQPGAAYLLSLAIATREFLSLLQTPSAQRMHMLFHMQRILFDSSDGSVNDVCEIAQLLVELSKLPNQEARDAAMLNWLKLLVTGWLAAWESADDSDNGLVGAEK